MRKSQKERFEEWKSLALQGESRWSVIPTRNKTALLHKGNGAGYFVAVERTGTVRVGGFRGGRYYTAATVQAASYHDGLKRILSAINMTSFMGLFE